VVQLFVFNELAVKVRHWYEVATSDQEHGIRLEVLRRLQYPHQGSESASQPLGVDDLIWRVDLFDRIGDAPGSMRSAHYHLATDNEPTTRDYDPGVQSDPYGWTEKHLMDLSEILAKTAVTLESPGEELSDIRRCTPAIMAAVRSFAPDACDSPAKCQDATRDTVEIVQLMTTQFRQSSEDPRSRLEAWPVDS
jgi:hypothetical protein